MIISTTLGGAAKLVWISPILLLSITSLKCSEEGSSDSVSSMVCPGDNLTLSCTCCTTNHSSIQWSVNLSLTPLHLDRGEDGIRIIDEQSIDPSITINQTIIHFSKTSSSPLNFVSRLTIDNVTTNWNQTKIKCARLEGMSLATIHIIDIETAIIMIISDECFGANNVTVTLKWFENGVVFNSVRPPAFVGAIGSRSVQLTIPYNIEHSVSVAICGQPSPKAIKLLYIVCDEPTASDDLTVINYTAPALEGSIIAIECGSLSTNNYTSTCVEGRWEPNLGQISTRCGRGQGVVNIPAASNHSMLISIVISVLVSTFIFFTIGFVCGCVCQKYKQSIFALCKTQADQSSTDLNIKHEQQDSEDLEMSENVAYGPVGGFQLATS